MRGKITTVIIITAVILLVAIFLNKNKSGRIRNDNKIENILRVKLIEAGWTHFSLALKKYKERTDLMLQGKNDIFYFNSYFNWYIRQGILEYINLIKNKI